MSEAEGEITKHHSNTPIIDSSRIISIITHCIESGFFFVLYSCVISPPRIKQNTLYEVLPACPLVRGG